MHTCIYIYSISGYEADYFLLIHSNFLEFTRKVTAPIQEIVSDKKLSTADFKTMNSKGSILMSLVFLSSK